MLIVRFLPFLSVRTGKVFVFVRVLKILFW
nr:MAG TPA: hypothetical protein [Caudoviricetes sp.]